MLPEGKYGQLKTFLDVGDIIGASGSMKRTEKGKECLNSLNATVI